MTANAPSRGVGTRVLALILSTVAAGVAGAALGGAAFGIGVYLASYTDRLMWFYQAGAVAGLVSAVAYRLLRWWYRASSAPKTLPFVIAGFAGAVVLWPQMASEPLPMELNERIKFSLSWLLGSMLVYWLIGRRTRSAVIA